MLVTVLVDLGDEADAVQRLHVAGDQHYIYSFTFSQFMEIVLNVDNPNNFTNILYTMMAMVIVCCKVIITLVNHENFAFLIHKLTEGTFRPLVPAEREIRRKFDKMIR